MLVQALIPVAYLAGTLTGFALATWLVYRTLSHLIP